MFVESRLKKWGGGCIQYLELDQKICNYGNINIVCSSFMAPFAVTGHRKIATYIQSGNG